MINVALQLFTFEESRTLLRLLGVLELVVNEASSTQLVFERLDGARQTVTLGRLSEPANSAQFAEGYLRMTPARLRADWKQRGATEIIGHFSVSPSSQVWARLPGLLPNRVARNVYSVERAAGLRGPGMPMPSVLELTFRMCRSDHGQLLSEFCDFVSNSWRSTGLKKFATIDVGGEWLFFPKSGYNPNIADLHIYFDPRIYGDWREIRKRHNAFCDEEVAGQCVIQDESLRQPANQKTRMA